MPLALFLNYKHFQNVPKHRKYNEWPGTSHCVLRVVNSALLSSISDLPTHSLDHLTDNKHFGLHLSKHIRADDNNDYVLEYCLS